MSKRAPPSDDLSNSRPSKRRDDHGSSSPPHRPRSPPTGPRLDHYGPLRRTDSYRPTERGTRRRSDVDDSRRSETTERASGATTPFIERMTDLPRTPEILNIPSKPASANLTPVSDPLAALNAYATIIKDETLLLLNQKRAEEQLADWTTRSSNPSTQRFPWYAERNGTGVSAAEAEVARWRTELQQKAITKHSVIRTLADHFMAAESPKDSQDLLELAADLKAIKTRLADQESANAQLQKELNELRTSNTKLLEADARRAVQYQDLMPNYANVSERLSKTTLKDSKENQARDECIANLRRDLDETSTCTVDAAANSAALVQQMKQILCSKLTSKEHDDKVVGLICELRKDIDRHRTSIQDLQLTLGGEHDKHNLLPRLEECTNMLGKVQEKLRLLEDKSAVAHGDVQSVQVASLLVQVQAIRDDVEKSDEDHGAEFEKFGDEINQVKNDNSQEHKVIFTAIEALQNSCGQLNGKIKSLEDSSHSVHAAARSLTSKAERLQLQMQQAPLPPSPLHTPLNHIVALEIEQLREVVRFLEDRYNNLTTEEVVRLMADQIKRMYPLDMQETHIRKLMSLCSSLQNDMANLHQDSNVSKTRLENRDAALQQDLSSTKAALDGFRDEINDIALRIAQLENNTLPQSAAEHLKDQIRGIQADSGDCESELQSSIVAIGNICKDLKMRSEENTKQIQDSEYTIGCLVGKLDDLTTSMDNMSDVYNSINAKLKIRNGETDDVVITNQDSIRRSPGHAPRLASHDIATTKPSASNIQNNNSSSASVSPLSTPRRKHKKHRSAHANVILGETGGQTTSSTKPRKSEHP